jgi:hypothetical protein
LIVQRDEHQADSNDFMTGAVVAPTSTSNWEWLPEREERDWIYSGRLRHERNKKLRDPQDVLIETDRLLQRLTEARGQRNRGYFGPSSL